MHVLWIPSLILCLFFSSSSGSLMKKCPRERLDAGVLIDV